MSNPKDSSQQDSTITPVQNEKGYFAVGSIINVMFGIILSLLAIRFIFRLLGASPTNAFASLIYNLSQPLVSPFFGLFHYQAQLESTGFEVATLIALLVYGIIAGVITRLLYRDRHRV